MKKLLIALLIATAICFVGCGRVSDKGIGAVSAVDAPSITTEQRVEKAFNEYMYKELYDGLVKDSTNYLIAVETTIIPFTASGDWDKGEYYPAVLEFLVLVGDDFSRGGKSTILIEYKDGEVKGYTTHWVKYDNIR